jgi:hypothetical protein
MYKLTFNVQVPRTQNDKALMIDGEIDFESDAYLIFERTFKTKAAAEKWAEETFTIEMEYKDDCYFVAPTPYGHGHSASFWIQIGKD